MMDLMAAASTAVKFGSAVMAAVAAFTVSSSEDGMVVCGFGCGNWVAAIPDDTCSPENLDWLSSVWPKTGGRDGG